MKFENHHLIPQSRFEEVCEWDCNNIKNIKRINQNTHKALHSLFWNKTPKEQLYKIFELNKWVISNDVQTKLIELFTMDDEDFYGL